MIFCGNFHNKVSPSNCLPDLVFCRGMVLICQYCHENCHTAKKLKIHHEKKKCKSQFPCEECGLAFRTAPILKKHMKNSHQVI